MITMMKKKSFFVTFRVRRTFSKFALLLFLFACTQLLAFLHQATAAVRRDPNPPAFHTAISEVFRKKSNNQRDSNGLHQTEHPDSTKNTKSKTKTETQQMKSKILRKRSALFHDVSLSSNSNKIWTLLLQDPGTAFGTPVEAVKMQQKAVLDILDARNIEFTVRSTAHKIMNIVTIEISNPNAAKRLLGIAGVKSIYPDTYDFSEFGSKTPASQKLRTKRSSQTRPHSRNDNDDNDDENEEDMEDGHNEVNPDAISQLLPHILTGVRAVHAKNHTGRGVKIAIFDSGIDAAHEAFGKSCYGKPGCKIAKWRDYVGRDERPTDCSFEGHGTSVAAIAAGRAGEFVGVAPDAKLYIYRLYGCRGHASVAEFTHALEDAIFKDKVDVINLSFGELVCGIVRDKQDQDDGFFDTTGEHDNGGYKSVRRGAESSFGTNQRYNDFNFGGAGPRSQRSSQPPLEKNSFFDITTEDLNEQSVPPRTALELAITSAAAVAPYVHFVSVAGNFGPNVFSVASPGISSAVLSVAAMDTGAVLVRRMRVHFNATTAMARGSTTEDANFVFSLDWPLTQRDVSSDMLLKIDLHEATSCLPSEIERQNALKRVVLLYVGVCALRPALDVLGVAGSQAVLVALEVDSLSSMRARERVGATLASRWAKLVRSDAERLFGSLEAGLHKMPKMEIGETDLVERGSEEANMSSFSSFGPAFGLAIKPQVSAYGTHVFSALPQRLGKWGFVDGTSMAAPYVAGCIALVLEANGRMLASRMRGLLMATATPSFLPSAKNSTPSSRAHRGAGPLQAGVAEGETDAKRGATGAASSSTHPTGTAIPVLAQGGGLINVLKALESKVEIEPPEGVVLSQPPLPKSSGESGLPRIRSQMRLAIFKITNTGTTPVKYVLGHMPALAVALDGRAIAMNASHGVRIKYAQTSVVLGPGKPHHIRAAIWQPVHAPDGAIFSGYLTATPCSLSNSVGGSMAPVCWRNSTMRVPYQGQQVASHAPKRQQQKTASPSSSRFVTAFSVSVLAPEGQWDLDEEAETERLEDDGVGGGPPGRSVPLSRSDVRIVVDFKTRQPMRQLSILIVQLGDGAGGGRTREPRGRLFQCSHCPTLATRVLWGAHRDCYEDITTRTGGAQWVAAAGGNDGEDGQDGADGEDGQQQQHAQGGGESPHGGCPYFDIPGRYVIVLKGWKSRRPPDDVSLWRLGGKQPDVVVESGVINVH